MTLVASMVSESGAVRKSDQDQAVIGIGSIVTYHDIDEPEIIETITLVEHEGNPREHKVSILTPLGQALMGREAGAIVEVKSGISWNAEVDKVQ